MASKVTRIGSALVAVQQVFLDTPRLRLTLPQIETRFALDAKLSRAVIDVLVDAHVLRQRADGAYERFFPRLAQAA